MVEALRIWRRFPRQIASDLQLHYRRHIREWLGCVFTMSSLELLELLDGLPETSKFKEASERWLRVVEYIGDNPDLKGELLVMSAAATPGPDVRVVAEYIDWTHDRKILARNTQEIISLRVEMRAAFKFPDYEPDFTGLIEPLQVIRDEHKQKPRDDVVAKARRFLRI